MQSNATWHNRLQQITTLKNAGLKEWQPIHSGSSNHIFKAITEEGIWMVRINRAALGIDRHEEKKILAMTEGLGIGPKVIENNPDQGHLITEYIDQPAWTQADLQNPDKLLSLKNLLQRFHTIPYEYLPSRLDHRLKLYLKTIKRIPVKTALELLNTIEKLDFLGFWQTNTTLYHSDLNLNNLLGHNSHTTIIDWEFSGQGHPLLDWLILEHETGADLSAHYPESTKAVWLEPARRMINAMMNLWPHESP